MGYSRPVRFLGLCLVAAVLISCGGAQKNSSANTGGLSEDRMAFIETFWEDDNVAHYITTIDALIDRAVANASVDASVSGQDHDDTDNGVRIIVSLTHLSDRSVYHVSFSHRPYLATLLAKKFAGLLANRLGFSIPEQVMVSQNQVFHLEWSGPNTQEMRDKLSAARKQIRAETSIQEISNYILLNTLSMKIEKFSVPGQ